MKLAIKNLPTSSGVYLFKNDSGQVIYVGKALNLKNRVSSYFQKNPVSQKLQLLLNNISKLETIKVESEIEALLLEAKLIKYFQPEFNSQLKDDKDYLYIVITKDKFPAVITGRKQDLDKARLFFGPFPSSTAVRSTLKTIRKVIPYRINCKPESSRACLSAHLGLCPGVCSGKINSKDYSFDVSSRTIEIYDNAGNLVDEIKDQGKSFDVSTNGIGKNSELRQYIEKGVF